MNGNMEFYYHVQRLMVEERQQLISLESLENNRPLFISSSKDWFYPDTEFERFYLFECELHIDKVKALHLKTDDYFDLFFYDGVLNKFVLDDKIKKYIAQGYNLFIKEEKRNTESELFISHPRDIIKELRQV